MMKYLLITNLLLFVSSHASALTFKCIGQMEGYDVKSIITIPGITSLDETTSSLIINGEEVATFREGEVDVSIFRSRFKAANNYGDEVEGKIESIKKRKGFIKKIKIPTKDIFITNMTVMCEKIKHPSTK